jgi:D-alanyl-D-alanine carboxypeptidase
MAACSNLSLSFPLDRDCSNLLNFAQALMSNKLLDAQHTKMLTTGKVQIGNDNASQYAYGFFDHTEDGVRVIGHAGGAQGMNGDLKIYPDSGYTLVVLSNLDPPAATRIFDYVDHRLPAK